MNVKLINKGTTGEVLLSGRLDSSNASDVEKILMDLGDRFDDITLNLASLEYTSSAGLRIILRLSQKLMKKGGELSVSNVSPSVMEVFELTGFAGVLNIV